MQQANAVYVVKDWDRKPWRSQSAANASGAKLFRLEVQSVYEGDIQGEGTIQYLITQNADGSGNYMALEKIRGSVGGRSGSFVLQRTGTFAHGKLQETVAVAAGSGTDALSGLSGHATLEFAGHQERYPIQLAYEV